MTYIGPRSMGAWFNPIIGLPSEEIVCLNEANAKVASLDAKIMDLAKTWNPTGFYKPDEIQRLIIDTMALVSKAYDAISKVPRLTSAPDATNLLEGALRKLAQQGERSMIYVQALRDAHARGANVINAAGLKTWVLDTMQAAVHGLVTASVLECQMPWLASAIIAFQGFFDALIAVTKRIVGVVISTGDAVLTVAEGLPAIINVLKWGLAIGGAAWMAMHLREIHRRSK